MIFLDPNDQTANDICIQNPKMFKVVFGAGRHSFFLYVAHNQHPTVVFFFHIFILFTSLVFNDIYAQI